MEVAAIKLSDSASAHSRKSHGRSRVSNGRDVLPDVDGRSIIARRYRDIMGAILSDQGGVAQCSESRLQLVRRFAAAAVLAEQLEARLANGETIDIAEHATLSSTLVRLAAKIGIDRVAKDIGVTLDEVIRLDHEEELRETAAESASAASEGADESNGVEGVDTAAEPAPVGDGLAGDEAHAEDTGETPP